MTVKRTPHLGRAIGRRKSAVASVILQPGHGEFYVNQKPVDEYFSSQTASIVARQPLVAADLLDKFTVRVRVRGGGVGGQAGAVRHALSRALVVYDEANAPTNEAGEVEGALGLKKVLRKKGYLTRDSREVERKKFGLRKARRRRQFSKR